jgi:putative oxidoreductase
VIIRKLESLHDHVFDALTRAAGDWFMGLAARLAFSSVLMAFFWNSAATKLGEGFPGIFMAKAGAYAQVLPPIAEAAGYDASKIAFLPWGLIVHLAAYAEFLIPLLLLVGLFTRLSALAMIGFVAVMTFVDIKFHGIGEKAVGAFFDRTHDSIVSDQRLLWLLPLVYLVIYGGGAISVDALLAKVRSRAGA